MKISRLAVLAVVPLLVSCQKFEDWYGKVLGFDNAGEEILEQVIDQETGLDLDLTPGSPEIHDPY